MSNVFADLFTDATQVVFAVYTMLNSVYINAGYYDNYVTFSLMEILEIIFGVKVLFSFSKLIINRKVDVEA